MERFRAQSLHLISRVRLTTTARAPFSPVVSPRGGRGRRRKWGSKIRLKDLFSHWSNWDTIQLNLYGTQSQLSYQRFELHWDSPDETVLFVLVRMASGQSVILLSTDTTLSASEVITAYSWRFKIEVSFRFLVNLLQGFDYHFWLKDLPKRASRVKRATNLKLAEFAQPLQAQVQQKLQAYERFVNLNLLALGLLQLVALDLPEQIWHQFHGWFRTYARSGWPSEQVSRLTLQQLWRETKCKRSPALLLNQIRWAISRDETPAQRSE